MAERERERCVVGRNRGLLAFSLRTIFFFFLAKNEYVRGKRALSQVRHSKNTHSLVDVHHHITG